MNTIWNIYERERKNRREARDHEEEVLRLQKICSAFSEDGWVLSDELRSEWRQLAEISADCLAPDEDKEVAFGQRIIQYFQRLALSAGAGVSDACISREIFPELSAKGDLQVDIPETGREEFMCPECLSSYCTCADNFTYNEQHASSGPMRRQGGYKRVNHWKDYIKNFRAKEIGGVDPELVRKIQKESRGVIPGPRDMKPILRRAGYSSAYPHYISVGQACGFFSAPHARAAAPSN